MHKIYMNGREVFRFGTHIMNECIREVVNQAHLTLKDIKLIVPHQANQRIISAAARSLGLPENLFYTNLQRYGNTSAASIPIALCEAERDKRINPNDNIVLIGFGGGLSWAAAVIQWQVVPLKTPAGIPFRLSQGRREAQYIFAFWRARIMRAFRRLEAIFKGSPTKEADTLRSRPNVPRIANGGAPNGNQRSRLPDKVAEKVEKAAAVAEPEKTVEHN
jgi:3-oxoacyl-[acyl-carrier-protein] synthase-3